MNRNLSKLLQSLAGVVIFSMASLSMAATYTYDFDADEHERGGQPLVFCLLYTSPSPRDVEESRMPSSA